GKPYDLHGIQVGVGTILTLKLYRHIRALKPSREKAEAHMAAFSREAWEAETRRIFGRTADEVLKIEEAARKNDPANHAVRLARTLDNWDEICRIIDEELPDYEALRAKMEKIGEPVKPSDLNISLQDTLDAFTASRDIRNKFLTSSMLWDLGEMDDFREILRREAEV
ncbi:MAG: sn-glycerol-1-phosphate dehydrogenase, partial [Lachnospiraceae bacterium]|nr:sn-glycerol-1-phosphate dehydrogenase [Lachnospiraceae bacterium]